MINITSQKGFIHPPSLRWWQWLLGNRTQKTATTNGTAQASNTPVKAGTNQYQAYSYDASGKTLNDGVRSYVYNSEGRIVTINQGNISLTNGYNALGQRVVKGVGSSKTYFIYDETGKLLSDGEREFIYLGNSPIAMISSQKPNEVLQIHTDNLATPRAITNAKNEVLWRWEGEAFGDVKPSVEMVKMPLRFAGQYSDDEVGLYYNYFRFYNPATGRYVENDPIDLAGGLNRYGYVGGNPLLKVDPRGLVKWNAEYRSYGLGASLPYFGTVGYTHWLFDLESKCENNTPYKIKIKTLVASANAGFAIGLTGHFSFSTGTGEFDDHNGNYPNPYAFEGKFLGYSVTRANPVEMPLQTASPFAGVIMGTATGDISGVGVGTDIASALLYGGVSILQGGSSIEECNCAF